MITSPRSLSLFMLLCFGVITGSMQAEMSLPALSECYKGKDSEYRYLEFFFMEQPRNALKARSASAMSAIFAVIPAAVLTRAFMIDSFSKKDMAIGASTLLIGKAFIDYYVNQLNAQIKHDTLVKFLTNWSFHFQHIPTQLIPAFDELAASFNASSSKTLTNEQVSEFFEVIQHLIEHEFSKRYEKDKMKDADTLAMVKTITDISKNLA